MYGFFVRAIQQSAVEIFFDFFLSVKLTLARYTFPRNYYRTVTQYIGSVLSFGIISYRRTELKTRLTFFYAFILVQEIARGNFKDLGFVFRSDLAVKSKYFALDNRPCKFSDFRLPSRPVFQLPFSKRIFFSFLQKPYFNLTFFFS